MNSFISWVGGKNYLKKEIVKNFPERYSKYIEVFGGAGWVLFYKEQNKTQEIYNDINGELVNLFRCVKYNLDELHEELKWWLNSREIFNSLKNKDAKSMSEIERAARFFILLKTSYGSKMKCFGVKELNVNASVDFLKKAHKRLSKVKIENLDYKRLLKLYDNENALFT